LPKAAAAEAVANLVFIELLASAVKEAAFLV
jgi:hypothetical protein